MTKNDNGEILKGSYSADKLKDSDDNTKYFLKMGIKKWSCGGGGGGGDGGGGGVTLNRS